MSLPSILAIALLSGPWSPLTIAVVPPPSPLLAQASGESRDRGSLQRLLVWGGVGAVGLGSLGAGVWLTLGALRKRGDREDFFDEDGDDDEDENENDDENGHDAERDPHLGGHPADGPTPELALETPGIGVLEDAWAPEAQALAAQESPSPPKPAPPEKPAPKGKGIRWPTAKMATPKPGKAAAPPKPSAKSAAKPPENAPEPPPAKPAIAAPGAKLRPSPAAPEPTPTLATRVIQPSAFERLVGELQDRNATTRRRAIWQLGQMGDSRAIEPLLELTIDGDSKQRSLVMAALSEIGARTVKPMGRAAAMALQDDNPEVRMNAIRDLAQLCDRLADLSRVLAYATEDTDPEVKKTAQWAVKRLAAIRSLSDRQRATPPPTGADAIAGLAITGEAGDRWLDQAEALVQGGQTADAEQLLEESLRYEPSNPAGHQLLAQVRRTLGKLGSALSAEMTARDLYASQGNLTAARALEATWGEQNLDPDEAAIQAARGVRLFSQGNYTEAQTALETAIALNPHAPAHHAILGRLLRQQGKLAEALQSLTQARDLYVERGNLPEARKMQQLLRQLG